MSRYDYHKTGLLKCVSGPRGRGWFDAYKFYSELADISKGKYIWIMNDDCTVHGPWFEELAKAPDRAFIQPEHYGLNQSKYSNCADIGFPIVPRDCWKEYGLNELPDPIDLGLYNLLVKQNGWPVHYLKGVTVQHDRANDVELAKHRA